MMSVKDIERRRQNRRWQVYRPPLILTVLGIISVITILWLNYLRNQQIHNDYPIDDATMELELEIANYHLWLEEYLSGDITIKSEDIKSHITRATSLCKALLEGRGKDEHGFPIQPLKTKETKDLAKRIFSLLKQFEALSYERIKKFKQAGVGSQFDQRHDQIYKHISAKIKALKSLIMRDISANLSRYQLFFKIILGSWIVIISVAVAGFLRMERRLHQTAEKLWKSRNRFQNLLETTHDWIWEMNRKGEFSYVSPQTKNVLGYDPEELIGKPPAEFIKPEEAEGYPEIISRMLYSRESFEGLESVFIHKDGHPVVIEGSGVPFFNAEGKISGYRGINRDITKRKRMEEELANSREKLRNLHAHVESAREKERTGIAREIHDELGQAFTAIKLDLSYVSDKLPQPENHLKKILDNQLEFIDECVGKIQKISSYLRPSILDDLGILAAIKTHVDEFQTYSGIRCTFTHHPEKIVLAQDHATVVFRIFQEALTNIVRHAHATAVKISLKKENHELILKIEDNGKGINENELSSLQSFGIIGMQERILSVGGKIDIKGIEGKGTTIAAVIPIGCQKEDSS